MPTSSRRTVRRAIPGEMTVNPASLGAGAIANTDVTGTSARVGDLVQVFPPATLEAGIVVQGASCPANGTIRIRLYNPTAGAVDAASATWSYVLNRQGA